MIRISVILIALACTAVGCKQSNTSSNQPVATSDTRRQISFEFDELRLPSENAATYLNGEDGLQYSILESLGGGVAMLDFDQDGLTDLGFAGGGKLSENSIQPRNCALYRNRLHVKDYQLVPSTALPDSAYYNHGWCVGDYDNDGFPDVIVTGYGGVQFLKNQGDGTFEDATQISKLEDPSWSTSAAWGDFNNDGNIDLYMAHYVNWSWQVNPRCNAPTPGQRDVCSPNEFKALDDSLFLSHGDGTFANVAATAGLEKGGKGLGVLTADLNQDGNLDIYVANDTTSNFLYAGDGSGRFQESALLAGVAVDGGGAPNGSMGICLWDFDNDLQPDLWVTNYENESIAAYQNKGNMTFTWASERMGLAAIGRTFVGFGVTAGDFDCDGDEDLVVVNGHVIQFPANSSLLQVPLFFENTGKVRVTKKDFPSNSYFTSKHRGRGVVRGDLNLDGGLDLVVSHANEPPIVLLNRRKSAAVKLKLVGNSQENRDCIGASVVLETNKGKYAKWISGGGSYLSQNPYELTWQLTESERALRFHVHWPNSTKVQIVDDPQNSMVLVH